MRSIFKFTSLLLASAVMFLSCEKTGDDTDLNAGFQIASDKNVIQSNGTDVATFTAVLDGKDVTAETTFYLKDTMNQLDGNKLTADKDGEYNVIGMYGTFYTKDPVPVTAINVAVPGVAADPDPSKTSFVHRVFINQYTGTGCGYCPGMISALREVMADEQIKNTVVHAAIHSYGAGDPAYIAVPKVNAYPYMEVDMAVGVVYDKNFNAGVVRAALGERASLPAKVGISANPVLSGDLLVVTVEVKAEEDGEYNLGVWFLQDNVYGQQTDYLGIADSSYNYHENCVRKADSRYGNTFAGHPLGEIKAGKTAQKTFVLNIDKTAWKLNDMNDLHFVAFVTTKNGKFNQVVNVVDCKISEPTPFEYK